MKKVIDNLEVIYIYTAFLIFLFISENNSTSGCQIRIFFVHGNDLVIFIFLTILVLTLTTFMKMNYIKLDIILMLLGFRMILGLIPIMYTEYSNSYWGNYYAVITCFTSYFIGKQYRGDIKKALRALVIFSIIIALQVFGAAMLSDVSFTDVYFKYFISIPIGVSNRIATLLVPAYFLSKYFIERKNIRVISCLIIFFATILTKSRNAIFIFIIYYLWIGIKKIYENKKVKISRIIATIAIILLVVSIYLLGVKSLEFESVKSYFIGFTNSISDGNYSFLDKLTSLRLSLYKEQISVFFNHPILGNGFSYINGQSRAHNFILELLVQSGIVGTIIYFIALFKWVKNVKKSSNNNNKAVLVYMIVTLLMNFAEISMFTCVTDTIMWFFIGISSTTINRELDEMKLQDLNYGTMK